jgi:hypothetical protein
MVLLTLRALCLAGALCISSAASADDLSTALSPLRGTGVTVKFHSIDAPKMMFGTLTQVGSDHLVILNREYGTFVIPYSAISFVSPGIPASR